jgi:hypothetical protein
MNFSMRSKCGVSSRVTQSDLRGRVGNNGRAIAVDRARDSYDYR